MIVRRRKSRVEEALLLRRRDVFKSSLAGSGKSRGAGMGAPDSYLRRLPAPTSGLVTGPHQPGR
jgi:hypothetical protein